MTCWLLLVLQLLLLRLLLPPFGVVVAVAAHPRASRQPEHCFDSN